MNSTDKSIQERLTARTALFNERNEILLLQFKLPNEIFWLTPGGKIENGETPLMAAQRELFEETGISDAHFITPHSYYSESISNRTDTPVFFKEHIFVAHIKNQTSYNPHFSDEEKKVIIASKWWNLHEFSVSGEIFYPQDLLSELLTVYSTRNNFY